MLTKIGLAALLIAGTASAAMAHGRRPAGRVRAGSHLVCSAQLVTAIRRWAWSASLRLVQLLVEIVLVAGVRVRIGVVRLAQPAAVAPALQA